MIYSIPKNFRNNDKMYKLVPIDKKLKNFAPDYEEEQTDQDEGFSFCSYLITTKRGYNKLLVSALTVSCCLSSMSIGSLFIN
jgi:hypothetical protein